MQGRAHMAAPPAGDYATPHHLVELEDRARPAVADQQRRRAWGDVARSQSGTGL
jgi:hypothetical protein